MAASIKRIVKTTCNAENRLAENRFLESKNHCNPKMGDAKANETLVHQTKNSSAIATKLSDTQLIILSSAARHPEGFATLPDRLRGGAAIKAVGSLTEKGLLTETLSKPGMPMWRRDEDGRSFSLKITKAGKDSIGLAEESHPSDHVASDGATKDIESSQAGEISDLTTSELGQSGAPRTGSKQALLVSMLASVDGASIEELVAATGWLAHTTRAALTGLRKRGYRIERNRREGQRTSVYRIVVQPQLVSA